MMLLCAWVQFWDIIPATTFLRPSYSWNCAQKYGVLKIVEQFNSLPLWLFNIAMGNGPFLDGIYLLKMVTFHGYVE